MQHHRQSLGRRNSERDVRTADRRVCVCRVRGKLTADELGKLDAILKILA